MVLDFEKILNFGLNCEVKDKFNSQVFVFNGCTKTESGCSRKFDRCAEYRTFAL